MRAQTEPAIEISGLPEGRKVHVRAVALNAQHESAPGPDYPLYITSQPPLPPDGLHVDLAQGAATVSWGEVLGVAEYRLYARVNGAKEFTLLYRGLDRLYVDRRPGIQPCNPFPGTRAGARLAGIVEYAVSCVNGIGEGLRSLTADTDPSSWRNWDPKPGEPFRRLYIPAPIYLPSAPATTQTEATRVAVKPLRRKRHRPRISAPQAGPSLSRRIGCHRHPKPVLLLLRYGPGPSFKR